MTTTLTVTEPGMVWVYLVSLFAAFAPGGFVFAGLADTGRAGVAWAVRRIFRHGRTS